MTTRRALAGTAVTALLFLGPVPGAFAAETPSPSGSASGSASSSGSASMEESTSSPSPSASPSATTSSSTSSGTTSTTPTGAPDTGSGGLSSDNTALAAAGAVAMLAALTIAGVALRRRPNS